VQGIANQCDRSESNPNGDLQTAQAGIEENRQSECLPAVTVMVMFQSTLAAEIMMLTALLALSLIH